MAKPTDEIKLPRYVIERIASLMENPKNQSLELRKEAAELRRTLATHESWNQKFISPIVKVVATAILLTVVGFFVIKLLDPDEVQVPHVIKLRPDDLSPGQEFDVLGEGLDQVAGVHLTHGLDPTVQIIYETISPTRFMARIPDGVKPGSYNLGIITKHAEPITTTQTLTVSLQSTPIVTAAPTPPPAPTRAIPADFTIFTDQSETFSIGYPDHWDLALSQMDLIDELLRTSPLDLDISQTALVFAAADMRRGRNDPNVNIRIVSVPSDLTDAEFFEGSLRAFGIHLKTAQVPSQQPVQIGELRGLMVEVSYDLAEVSPGAHGRWTVVTLATKRPDSGVAWSLACGFSESAPEDSLDTCEAVVKSFRLLR